MMVAKISTEHTSKLEEVQEEFNKEIEVLNLNEKHLKVQLEVY